MTEKNRDFLLVAAIDIGTTYSGDAYSMKDTYKTNPLTIHANQAWNADGRTVLPLKTPTSLLLNSKKEFDSFGYEAENKYAELVMVGEQDNYYYFHGFKIDMLNNKNEDSDMMLEDVTGKIVPAIDVFALSIKALVNHLMYTLTQGTGVTLDDIQWVLTVPAIWTDNLMQFMRTSSEKAGLKRDHLLVLKESEAAALFCQHLPIEKLRGAKYGFKMSKLRTTYMIVDLGGATVDVTVHAQLFGGGIKELCCRTNGGCGGTSVDTSFIHMFENIFGKPLLNTMKREHPLVYLELLREFETVKMTIIPTKTGKINIKVPFPTLDALCKTHLQKDVTSTVLESTYSSSISIRGDKMRIEEKLFKSFFDTTIKCILEMLQEMIERIGFFRIVTSIILVGSFSECSLVQETIRKTFSTRNVIVPEDSGLAVLKGAVIYGHRKMINSEFDDNGHVDHSEYFDIQKMDSTKRHPPLVDENATLSAEYLSSVSYDEELVEPFDCSKIA